MLLHHALPNLRDLRDQRDVALDLRRGYKPGDILSVDQHRQSGARTRLKAKGCRCGQGDERCCVVRRKAYVEGLPCKGAVDDTGVEELEVELLGEQQSNAALADRYRPIDGD